MHVQLHLRMYEASFIIFYDYKDIFFLFAHEFISFIFTGGNHFFFPSDIEMSFSNCTNTHGKCNKESSGQNG